MTKKKTPLPVIVGRTGKPEATTHIGCSIAQPNRTGFGGVYTCPELTTNPHRPGSGDAARLPSLFAGQRITRGSEA